MSTKDYADMMKDLPQNAPDGITFTEVEVNGILGDNAATILSLKGTTYPRKKSYKHITKIWQNILQTSYRATATF